MRITLAAALIAGLGLACGDTDDTDDTDDSGDDDGIPVNLSDCSAVDGDDLVVSAASIDGDTLTADVGYGGGCETHEFALCWPDETFAESEPVQVWLEIWHNDNGDACEAWASESLDFDLTPLADSYRSAYGGGGTISIHIQDQGVSYEVSAR